MSSKSDLTPYQKEAIRRFSRQRVAALFMEMGTGKTRTAVELANLHADRYDIVLWLAPVSTLDNAKAEVLEWGGFRREELFIGYESIASSSRIYLKLRKELEGKRVFLICDESLYLRNGDSKRWRRAWDIRSNFCDFCILLNGTPMSRDEMDIYWQMQLLSPKILGMPEREFRRALFTRVKVQGKPEFWKRNPKNLPWLKSKIEPYVYECSLEIPAELKPSDHSERLIDACEARYAELKKELLDKIKKDELSDGQFMGYLTKLKQVAGANPRKNHAIAKEIADKRTVVFCEFREELAQIAEETKNGAFEITGDTPMKERKEIIANWKTSQKPLLIMSGCGAFGHNLQEANVVYFASLPWDYAAYAQALHRCFRMGQKNETVEVRRWSSRCGISNMVEDCLWTKLALADYVRQLDWRKGVAL